MRPVRLTSAFCLLGLASTLLVAKAGPSLPMTSARDTFQGVVYENPGKWPEKNQDRVRILIAPNAKSGELLAIMLSAAVKVTGKPIRDELTGFAVGAESGAKLISRGDVRVKHAGNLTIATMLSKVEDSKAGAHDRIYELVTDGTNNAFAMVLSKGEATLKANQETVAKILLGFRPSVTTEVTPGTTSGQIPYADTPGKTPPDPLFRPSGKGRPLPAAGLVGGKPQGLWWTYTQTGSPTAYGTVFYPDGMALHYVRLGGPNLADLEGMKANQGAGDIGTWSLENGEIGIHFGELVRRTKYTTGEDSDGKFFKGGTQVYRPAIPLTSKLLVGTWAIHGVGSFTFKGDGTVQTTVGMIGSIRNIGTYDSNAAITGTWFLDGYLLVMKFPVEGYRVFPAFRATPSMIAISSYFYMRP